jgi:REP element-mobilizing transposase RayT
MELLPPLEPSKYYHLYNRGDNGENLFREERNYRYFIQLYVKHTDDICDTFAFCLLRNHFHLLIRVKERTADGTLLTAKHVKQQLSNFFNAYTKAINKAYLRTGSLFEKRYERLEVTNDRYFLALVRYIHRNPQTHGFVKDFRDYPYSSYHAFFSAQPSFLKRSEVLSWFSGIKGFEELHNAESKDKTLTPLVIERDEIGKTC